MTKSTSPISLKEQLKGYQQTLLNRQKYVKNEFQAYGLQLAEELHDWKNRSLYIRLAKTTPKEILESARLFIKDQNQNLVKNKARLFMWKLKELKNDKKLDKHEVQ